MNSDFAYNLISQIGVSSLELEIIISKDCHHSCYYSYYVIKGRFELGEEIISKNEYCSLGYAKNVLKGRFKLGEKAIVKNRYSYDYFIKVLGYNHE